VPANGYDAFEVRVLNDEAGPQLVAAIDLVSPSNKDRPAARRAFAIKCAAYLQQSISLIVIDVVTSRSANLHRELMDVMQLRQDQETSSLWASAYRLTETTEQDALETWRESLAIGKPLPTLPLWLNHAEAVPVDLAASYTATCVSLRMDGPN
jgi:hypothetical protein